jgi:dihydrofolate reductase
MTTSIIVAMTPDRVIGRHGLLPWHLPADLQRFKRVTMGHHLIMGRKTFDSIGRLLPGRTTIVISRQPQLVIPGARVVPSVPAALASAGADTEVFFVGGAQVYGEALPLADRIYLTVVHAPIDGDVRFPDIDPAQWRMVHEEDFPADQRNPHATTYRVLVRAQETPRRAGQASCT